MLEENARDEQFYEEAVETETLETDFEMTPAQVKALYPQAKDG